MKLNCTPSILKHIKGICMVKNSYNNCHRKYTNGVFLQMDGWINRSLYPMGYMPWNYYFASFGFLCVRDAWRRGNKITFSTILDFWDAFYLGIIATDSLSSTEASLNHREDGTMRETMVRGQSGSEASPSVFNLFPSSPARLLFLLGYPVAASVEERATETLVH